MSQTRRSLSRLKLLVLLALFIAPLLMAFVGYYGYGDRWLPKDRINEMPLIEPAVTLVDYNRSISDSDMKLLDDHLVRKWTIVHFIDQDCDDICQKALYHTRQVRLAVGKDAGRMQRIVIKPADVVDKYLAEQHPDIMVFESSTSDTLAKLQQIRSQQQLQSADAILVDPNGNAMMVLPVMKDNVDAKRMLKDIKKLLRNSRIG